MSNLATYTRQRLTKAARLRSLDATFQSTTTALRGLADRGFSLIGGVEKAGWAIGIDGYTARDLDTSVANLLGQLSTNELVYACMRERTKVLLAPLFVVERRQADGQYVVEDTHDLTALLRRPGTNLDTATFWRCLETSYSGVGRVYLEPVYRGGMLEQLNPLHPGWVQQRYDSDGRLAWYDWQPPGAPTIRFSPDELIVRRAVEWAEVPPLVVALGAVDADNVLSEYIRGFFYNSAVPSGILKVRGSWSREKTAETRANWNDVFRPDGTAQGAPAILDENIESYTRIGTTLAELDNQTLRSFIETRICTCFGVPPLIIYTYSGLLRAIESNLEAAWENFWDATAGPLLVEWADWINYALLTQYEDRNDVLLGNVRCRFDTDRVPWFQAKARARIELVTQLYDSGAVTMNELRTTAGLDEHPDGDVFKAPPSPPVPWQLPPAEPQEALSEPETAEDEEKALPVVHNVKAAPRPPQRLEGDVQKYLRDQYAKARRLWISGNDQGAEAVLREINEQLDTGIALFGVLAPAERKAYADSWKQAANRIDFEAVIDSGDVTAAVDVLAERCVGITETTRKEIADLIIRGTSEQQTDSEIAAALAELGFRRAKERAPLITRTETAYAASVAARDAYTASGVVGSLQWLTGPDPCEDCQARDGQTYDLASAPEIPAHPACVCDYAPIVAEVLA
jgi:HK97 family phage portal protein